MDIDVSHWRRFAATHGWEETLAALKLGLESGALTPRQADLILRVVRPCGCLERLAA